LILNPDTANPARSQAPYFHREDWCSFALAAVLVFIGYWFSLADNVGLGFSGIYSVGANSMGVPHPLGYPVWTIYGWLFTKLLPFSNIAWRLAISSAVAGALTCGVVALMVSRSSKTLLAGINNLQKLSPQGDRWLRIVAGCVAGMTFGFDGAFWRKAVIVDVWPLSMLLFATTLCLLLRWAHEAERKRYFVAACFVFGLTLTNSQALIPAGLGFYFYVVLADKGVGRDASIAASVLLTLWWLGNFLDFLPGFVSATREIAPPETRLILKLITTSTVCLSVILSIKTRRWLPSLTTCWVTLAFAAGTAFYFLIPVFSATNPPVNWGYPRNLEGFMHVLNRGQYEMIRPVSDCAIYLGQLLGFARSVFGNFGLFPTLTALIPLGFLFRFHMDFRLHLLRLLVLLLSFSALLVALLNPPPDRQGTELVAAYYTPSHLLIAVLMGYGLVLLGTMLSRPQRE
jgi:hypothetical protein